MKSKKNKLFSSPRWHQNSGAVRIGIEKEIVRKEQLEWKEELKMLEANKKVTQK